MPFSYTTAERTAVQGTELNCYVKLEIQDPDLAWVDVSADLDTTDFLNGVTLHDDIDNNTMSFTAELLRDTGPDDDLSLAPLVETSTLNRNAASAYAPMLDLVRMWRVSVAVMPAGDTPAGGDYHEIGKGYIDSIQVNDLSATIDLTGRGEEAIIIDAEILDTTTYSVGTVDDMETVIQQLLDANMDDPPTLYVPVPTSYIINEYEQQPGNLMGAVQAVAALDGYVLRYRYDSAGVNRLTLFLPDRDIDEDEAAWEIGPDEYLRNALHKIDISGVRNYVQVTYINDATGTEDTVISPMSGTSGSITTYRKRPLPIDLALDTQVTTEDRAQGLADAVRADLEYPKVQQQFETFGFWFVQLCDYGKLLDNGVMIEEAA